LKALIIEDEAKTAAYLNKGLAEHGFVVDTASDGETGLLRARNGEYDVILVDVMLPGLDGWSVVAALRREGIEIPILFLTARDDVADRVRGLELGADDYLVKPFAFSELLARVRSIQRRIPARSPDRVHVADLEIDIPSRKVTRGGKAIDLTSKEFLLLSLLARRAGEPLSRTIIADHVWGMNFDPGTNVVDVHVRRLRMKVDEPFPRKLIHTVRGVGYVLEERENLPD
jgi:two-component system copper resistance phosphate regulon response regulator CusR